MDFLKKTSADHYLSRHIFRRAQTGAVPELEVTVDEYQVGHLVIVNSLDHNPRYHRDSRNPIPVAKITDVATGNEVIYVDGTVKKIVKKAKSLLRYIIITNS